MTHRLLVTALVVVGLATACAARREAQWDAAATTGAGTGAEEADALAQQAEELWSRRDDRAALEQAIAAYERLAQARPDDAAVHTRLSRAYYFLADAHLRKAGTNTPEYLSTFEKGTAAGERGLGVRNAEFRAQVTAGKPVEQAASALTQEDVEAAYWYATNLGKWARAKGFATTLGNKDRIKGVMDRVLALDPEFFHGAPHRYFGAFYAVAPGFAGGDMNKSKEHFDKSLQIAPDYVATKVLMAEVYATKKDDRALFERLLDEVLATSDDVLPGLEPETKAEKEKARELKAKVTELF
jgi:tetratricopeptide (TPR) repeat protein